MRSENSTHDEAGSRTDTDPHRVAGQGEDGSADTCTEHESQTDGGRRLIPGIVFVWHAGESTRPPI